MAEAAIRKGDRHHRRDDDEADDGCDEDDSRATEADSNGYVSVLDENRLTVAEWPTIGEEPIADHVRPALIEFSYYGGIHRIDGKSTGVLPDSIPNIGVGSNVPHY